MSETAERSYYLVESMYFEKLLRTHFMLTQSTLLFGCGLFAQISLVMI